MFSILITIDSRQSGLFGVFVDSFLLCVFYKVDSGSLIFMASCFVFLKGLGNEKSLGKQFVGHKEKLLKAISLVHP